MSGKCCVFSLLHKKQGDGVEIRAAVVSFLEFIHVKIWMLFNSGHASHINLPRSHLKF